MPASTPATDVAVIVFAKAPLPGRAKTRLIPRLGAWGAARLQRRLIAGALRTARMAHGSVELHATPRARSALFLKHEKSLRIKLRNQRGEDLGERMFNAFAAALRCHRAVILIGSDCPALQPRDLRLAARWLCGGADAVLAPAEDGGYALIALRKVSRRIFQGIAWGGPDVYRETAQKLSALGYRWRSLRTVWDVDRPEDLERLRSLRFF